MCLVIDRTYIYIIYSHIYRPYLVVRGYALRPLRVGKAVAARGGGGDGDKIAHSHGVGERSSCFRDGLSSGSGASHGVEHAAVSGSVRLLPSATCSTDIFRINVLYLGVCRTTRPCSLRTPRRGSLGFSLNVASFSFFAAASFLMLRYVRNTPRFRNRYTRRRRRDGASMKDELSSETRRDGRTHVRRTDFFRTDPKSSACPEPSRNTAAGGTPPSRPRPHFQNFILVYNVYHTPRNPTNTLKV